MRIASFPPRVVIPREGVAERRRPSDDLAQTGPLLPWLWFVAGAILLLSAPGLPQSQLWWAVVPALAACGVGLAICRLDWVRVPSQLARAVPPAALLVLAAVGFGTPDSILWWVCAASLLSMWTGFALERIDVAMVALAEVVALPVILHARMPLGPAIYRGVGCGLGLVCAGATLHWLRVRLDRSAESAAQAMQHAAAAQAESARIREHAEQQRAQAAATELAERVGLQRQVADRTVALGRFSSALRSQTDATAQASNEMSRALDDVTSTAHITGQITTTMATRAQDAAELMGDRESSSRHIMVASDLIQAVAKQTNLLSLNAAIEAARAGTAGQGFAVVAREVKDLARQAGDNADSITRTLVQIQAQVTSAVDRVTEISAGAAELAGHNGSLAASLAQQSQSLRQVVSYVQDTDHQVSAVLAKVRELEQLSDPGPTR